MKKSLPNYTEYFSTFSKNYKGILKSKFQFIPFLLLLCFSINSFGQTTVVCADGSVNTTYCYGESDTTQFVFVSDSGFPLNLVFNAGTTEVGFDEVIVLDSDGVTNLNINNPYGNNGELSGLSWQSSGDTITLRIESDGSISCQSGSQTAWDWDVFCQTCIPQTVDFTVVGECGLVNEFFVEVDITDLGTATTVSVNDDQGSPEQLVTEPGLVTFGPYAPNTPVIMSVNNVDDPNCEITSSALTLLCAPPPNDCSIVYAGEDLDLDCDDVDPVDLTAAFMTAGVNIDEYEINALDSCPTPPLGDGSPAQIDLDDTWSPAIDMTFEFCFFGNTYDQIVIGANGLVTFDVSQAGQFCPWSFDESVPNPNLPLNAIYGAYHDIDPSVCGNIEYSVLGAAPARQFVVNFIATCQFSCNELETTQQIILYESSNNIDVNLFDKPVCPGWNDGNAVVGVQNSNGTIGFTPPGRNTGPWEATDEFWRFSTAGDPSYTFEWLANGTSIGTTQTITVTPTETTTYTASVTYEQCDGTFAKVSDDVIVNVTAIDLAIDLGEDQIFCDVASFEIVPNITGDITDATYLWSPGGETTTTITVSTSGTYSLEITKDACVVSDSVTLDFDLNPAIELGENFSTCFEQAVLLDASPSNLDPASVTYEWSLNGTVIAGAVDATLSVTETGTYSVVVTSGTCVSEDTIVISPANNIAIELGDNISTCLEEIIILDASPSNYDPDAMTYEWSLNGAVLVGETDAMLIVNAIGNYRVIVTFGECVSQDIILISPANDIEFDLGENFEACFDEVLTLDATPTNYDPSLASYVWSLDGFVLTGETNPTIQPVEYGMYSVTVSVGVCSNTDSISISPRTDLEVSISGDNLACPNEAKTLTTSTTETNVTYQWFLNGDLVDGETASSLTYQLSAEFAGTNTYTVVITLGECSGENTYDVSLYPIGNCTISQGISPNGSIGYNDTLDLEFLSDRTGIAQLQIFNRLGLLVFEQKNYVNEWFGQTDDGNDLPTGTYFYVIDLLGDDPIYGTQSSGWIYVNQGDN